LEGQRSEVVGEHVVTGPSADEAVNIVYVAAEQHCEQLWLGTGASRQGDVVERRR
jgi:hypothetical protein